MLAGNVMAAGPYRYLRNPLYVGLWCMVAAMAFLMPATGAVFAVVLITVFLIRLTLGEEAFLAVQIGQPYQAYLRAVPRFLPRLRGAPEPARAKPNWLRASLAELTPIGVFVAIVVFFVELRSRHCGAGDSCIFRSVADCARGHARGFWSALNRQSSAALALNPQMRKSESV